MYEKISVLDRTAISNLLSFKTHECFRYKGFFTPLENLGLWIAYTIPMRTKMRGKYLFDNFWDLKYYFKYVLMCPPQNAS